MRHTSKVRTLADAIGMIASGCVVALGGKRRTPMAAMRAIVRLERRDLQLIAPEAGGPTDLLVSAGWDRPTQISADRFRAASLGVPFLPRPDSAAADGWTAVPAIQPDWAIIHAHRASAAGHVQLLSHHAGEELDLAIARSARRVIVTVEQIVSQATIARDPASTILDAECVVEAPFGAHPFACPPLYEADQTSVPDAAAPSDHWAYLDRVGARALMAISRNRANRA